MAQVHLSNAESVSEKYKNLASLFKDAAAMYPERVALEFEGHLLRYKELDCLSDIFSQKIIQAHAELGCELTADKCIGISINKGMELYVGILAILKTGAAYVPLDPLYPKDRLEWICEDAAIDVVVIAEGAQNSFDGISKTLALNNSTLMSLQNNFLLDLNSIESESLAVVIYTSGSTGRPKGVMLEHKNISSFSRWYEKYCCVNKKSISLQFSTTSFDASLLDIFPILFSGGKLVIPSEEIRSSFDGLVDLIRCKEVTHAFLPPALLANLKDTNVPSLEFLITGGDVCDYETIKIWSSGRKFYNIYGPTECTILATTARFNAESHNRDIGRPIYGAICYVLDGSGFPCPTDEVGELYIGGNGVGRGYVGDNALNQERFLQNPFIDGATYYKTGDHVKWNSSGGIDFVGRIDSQIKIRGFLVDLGEIEHVILGAGFFNRAAVIANNDKQIIAYVANGDQIAGVKNGLIELKAFLRKKLPNYMVPLSIVELDALPSTQNGKIDRANLALRPVTFVKNISEDITPKGVLEISLAKIWASVLNIDADSIGMDDSFFDLGGHSILVSRMLLAVKKMTAKSVSLARFMENPTLTSLTLLFGDAQTKGVMISERVYRDATLVNEVVPLPTINEYEKAPRTVLLTGANGFLGCHLISQLLKHTRAKIYCLVRADSDAGARVRLDAALVKFGLSELIKEGRVQAICGDLERSDFGFTADRFQSLKCSVDAIYHNGANVNHVYDYSYLYRTNVESTINLLKFSVIGINKSFNYISTLSAASSMNQNGELLEDGPSNNPPAFINNGYNLTKWVSERLVWAARANGLSAKIFRPGNITGDSMGGICQPEKNRILLLIKGSLQLGIIPDWAMNFDVSPVDWLAEAIITLSVSKTNLDVFNLHNPKKLSWVDYVSTLKKFGCKFDFVASSMWQKRLLEIDESNALFDVISFYLDEKNEDIGDMSHIHSSHTESELLKLDIKYPEKNSELLFTHFNFLVDSGFLEVDSSHEARFHLVT
nr:non-ribosomal peptide synthetase [Polynucleobacter sp. JS-Safj-400b-B2]